MKTQVEVWEYEKYYTEANNFFCVCSPNFHEGFFQLDTSRNTENVFSFFFRHNEEEKERQQIYRRVCINTTLFNRHAMIIYLLMTSLF